MICRKLVFNSLLLVVTAALVALLANLLQAIAANHEMISVFQNKPSVFAFIYQVTL
jgi:hypothetical protein